MKDIDAALGNVRPFVRLVGTIVITVAAAKYFGWLPEVRGDYWQVAIAGMALRYW